jgi:hypothetical protein
VLPKRETRKPDPCSDKERFFKLGKRQRRVARFIRERAFVHVEAHSEAARSPAVERLEQRIIPGALQQVSR